MPPKRKTSDADVDNKPNGHASKRGRTGLREPHPNAKQTEDFGIVLRDFYPPEMSNERCNAYTNGTIQRPIETLQEACRDTADKRRSIEAGKAVVHWFKSDLRLSDNRGLHTAFQLARDNQVPLIGLYIVSPEDFEAHLTSPARVDFTLRTLDRLQRDLAELDIPLYMETQEKRNKIPDRVVELCQKWEAKHLCGNIEYEVDELRRDAKLVRLCASNDIDFSPTPDTCVVSPGALSSQQGNQYAVYTPWFRSWLAFLKENPDYLELSEEPGSNPGDARKQFSDLFDCQIPASPKSKQLSNEEKKRFEELYPAGEHEAMRRLEKFLEDKGHKYADMRSMLPGENTSLLSPYFACGALSARTAVVTAKQSNKNWLDRGDQGYMTWISEVAWRDFYKHVLAHWPFICMNKCFKPEHTNIEWEYDADQFQAWCDGKTGFPIVDAAMRQMKHCAWMHNRTRMVVSSFLSKDLMIDWRRGERYFMETLIDGDFASNHGGWGFGSSTGVDPQPYFRIFNPLRQSERFDPNGEYIRKWVPELRDISGKAIHDPYGNKEAAGVAAKNGYPKPIVDHAESRTRALERFKSALQKEKEK
ncbi:Cryptochrome/DNA photolyase class 1 [Penicillium manginii]|jgi:deoxyribodipyrimidine photo-lyase|uniref:Cryptochrome/DNA photolyase class 1 n=1 Tax=Penicillium manginii TaxID=203109 RepID=UPI00254795F5|nr:Cryptochrome/DNA photolyase class 1 [Penicillium manginii]KAJ5740050.1 Cryptochrome/DNA photolyase class 1 [Penicillium manginii]